MNLESQTFMLNLERFRSDRRQLGGMLLVMGICVTFQPLAGISSFIGVNQDGNITYFNVIWLICCGIIQIIFGTLAMVVGYLGLVHDYGSCRLTGILLLMTQLAWIPFVTGIIEVGIAASPPYTIETLWSSPDGIGIVDEYVVNPFIPEDYLPNKSDVLFFGAMGILGLISYGVGFFGSLAFLEFSLYTFDAGKPTLRNRKYYRGRLLFYSFIMLIAGMSQILLGAYVLFEFGGGPLSPLVGVAMYRVSFPEITMAVGSVQMIVGYYGVGNYLHLFPTGPNDNYFQIFAIVGWLSQLILQYIVQISYIEGNENSAALPSLVLYSFGMNILPPFLDYKMRTTSTSFNDENIGPINRDERIGIGFSPDLATPETPTRHMSYEKASYLQNVRTLGMHSRLEDNSDLDIENTDGTGIQTRNQHSCDPKPETLPYHIKNNGISNQRPTGGMPSRLFSSLRTYILDRGKQLGNKQTHQMDECKSVDSIPDQNFIKFSEESGIVAEETIRNHDESDIIEDETMENHDGLIDTDRSSTEFPTESGQHSGESGITVEEFVEFPISGSSVEETVEYPGNIGVPMEKIVDNFPESGISAEEHVEYPDNLSRESIFKRRTREEIGDDNNIDDQDTPPRSNESFNTDLEDTWGEKARQQILLSSIEEEDSHRMLLEEQTEKIANDGQKSSFSPEPIYPPRDFDAEDGVQEIKNFRTKRFVCTSRPEMHPSIFDSYYDYDTDDGFEISEATPDDDTAALDAKIDKLKGELISDINLESYLNQIL